MRRVHIVPVGGKVEHDTERWKGLCPYHDERTPSLSVTASTNTWQCFGCGLSGSVHQWYVLQQRPKGERRI